MLKRTNQKKLSYYKKKVTKLKDSVESIIDEHDVLTFDTEAQALEWFNCFPIETLSESLDADKGTPRSKPGLKDFKVKHDLRRKYNKSAEELEIAMIKCNMANIDCIIDKIEGILE